MAARKKIAVLGGGIGSLSAVFHLTEKAGWADEYDITVYQQGWRLGGKCASGHDMRPEFASRIYEHGLHLFAGFYHHSFDLLTRAYAEIDRPADHPNRTVWDAFTGLDEFTVMHQYPQPDGTIKCIPWYINMEPNSLVPGEASAALSIPQAIFKLVGELIKIQPPKNNFFQPNSSIGRDKAVPEAATPDPSSFIGRAWHAAKQLVEHVVEEVTEEAAEIGAHLLMRTIIRGIESHFASLAKDIPDADEAQPIWDFLMAAYFVQTVIQGVLSDDILEKGWVSIDDEEFSAWLYRHAVVIARDYKGVDDPYKRAQALIDWAPVRSCYDYVFGYMNGDPSKRAIAAGTGMKGLLKLALEYRGHFFWEMRGAMGDVVIAPVYLALLKRGVKFEFFNRVIAVRPNDDKTLIDRIEILKQAEFKDDTYRPLIDVPAAGWDVPLEGWPEEPLWDQLVGGEALRGTDYEYAREAVPPTPNRTLKRGEDFDEIILGISIGALHTICADLADQKARWRDMLDAVKTCPTLALQMWFNRTTEDLGCPSPGRTLTAMVEPFSTWADMTHLLSREPWRGEQRPASIAYFCGQLPPEIPRDDHAHSLVGKHAKVWLKANAASLWPRATPIGSTTGFDYARLHDPKHGIGEARFDSQYWRANINPSDLYVMCVPGSTTKRLRADESGYDNLFLTGDWTRNGLNAGAAEAATMAGVQCARAMRGDRSVVLGEGDL
ncbi:MAG: NAD(P)-binding protein [Pseudomonadota bacterium]